MEVEKYPYRKMKDRYGFISYDELASFFEASVPFHEMKVKLLKEE